MPDTFDYGNARLRALKAELFDERDYQELLAKDLDSLIGSLAQTTYKPDVEAALPRWRGLRCVQEAVRSHLTRVLRKIASFYSGRPGQQVELLLARWDRRNLLTVVRAQAVPPPLRREEDLSTLLTPAGRLDETDLNQLVKQPDLRAAIDLLVSWNIPDAATARTIRAAWPDFARSGDLVVLEQAVNLAYAQWLERQAPCGHDVLLRVVDDPLRWVLHSEIDHLNVLIALRLRAGQLAERRTWPQGAATQPAMLPFLPAGSLSFEFLSSLAAAVTDDDVVHRLNSLPNAGHWQTALQVWQRSGDLLDLERNLEDQLTREAISLFTRGDPLSIAVPIAFIWAQENEARNLRLLAQCLAQQMDRTAVRDLLLVPW